MVEEKFDDLVEELMQNPRFKEEYEALRPEFEAARAEMDVRARSSAGMWAEYANPDLIPLEPSAWEEAAARKYGT